MAYKDPEPFVEVDDRVFSNTGQEVELVNRTALVDELDVDGKPTGEKVVGPNPLFTKYRNANSRAWSKDADVWEVVWRRKGVPASEQVMATGTSSCKVAERQPIYVRVRVEEPSTNVPTEFIEAQP